MGGTNCRLALFEGSALARAETVPTGGPGFAAAARGFVGRGALDAACVAVAGPVAGGRATLTNHHEAFDAAELSALLGAPTHVINDFQAATRGLAELGPAGARRLCCPEPDPRGVTVAVGPGTGLGMGWMVPIPGGWHVNPTEGGHQDLAPHDPWEAALWGWLHDRHGHVSWERVLCGPGLVTLHDFAVSDSGLEGLTEPSPAMVGSSPAPACVEARLRFAALLGHFAGNCALSHLPRGGVWLCGGIPPRLSSRSFDAALVAGWRDKGRFAALVEGIPLSLVTDSELGLRGAAAWARGRLSAP